MARTLGPGVRLGPYEVLGALGAGAMGEVYRAIDTNLKRQVAIKVLPAALASDGERLARFQREAEVLASLNHLNIAAIYGLERADGLTGLVMELVEGPTLAERIATGPLAVEDALPIARQIAAALEAAHEQGIVHRDLKPANIKVRPDGTVKLLDFGLAKAVEGAEPTADATSPTLSPTLSPTVRASGGYVDARTMAGVILGTPAYMSPEQVRGRPADHRSDIWAFGVVLAEMVTGRRPFDGETISDTMAAVLTREPDLEGVPQTLRRLVLSCLAKDPRERLRHIGDALLVVGDSSIQAGASAARRTPGLVYAVAVVGTVAIAAALVWTASRPRAVEERITRFYVDAPAGTAFNYTYTASAISPDGRHIVFRVATATEAPGFWLRPLDSVDGRRLGGTDGGDFPFWSPDGRSIGFFATGKLKRVDLEGGSPIVIADAADADTITSGGSWNTEGVIIFGAPEGMYRVNASGGTPELFAPVNSAAGETGYGSPQFLPDGDRFLMLVRSRKAGAEGIYASSLSRPDQKTQLLATTLKASFVANDEGDSSYLLYMQGRTLLARRIDRRTLALGGDPVSIASNVSLFPPGFHAGFWSSDAGNVLAYRTEASDRPRLTRIYADGRRESEAGTDDFYTHIRLSRDGSRAAMELADGSGNYDVFTWDFARRVRTRQTFDAKPDRAPSWSPDGREIAFSSLRAGTWQIFRKDVSSGRPEQQLTTGRESKIVPSWSADGRHIVFIQIGATTTEDIWALPLDGTKPFPILQTPAIETNPSLSPDGRWLAFESPHTGRPEVFVMPFPATADAVDAAAPRWQVSTQGGSRPRWGGDGRGLFYVSLDDQRIMRSEVRGVGATFESDAPRVFAEIAVMPVARSPFDVSKDGQLLVLERTINSAALTVVTSWRALMRPKE